MPTYNEERAIGAALEGVLATEYPRDRLEVLVVDGRSVDSTRAQVKRLMDSDGRVTLIDNPGRKKPTALNLGIAAAKGEVIIRVDAHAEYPPDYIPRLVAGLDELDADNMGSRRRTHVPRGLVGAALALLVDSRLAAGNAHYRTGATEVRAVESVFGGCYRREVFEIIGDFDERLIRCQDRDLNDRLRAAGGRIVLDPTFECTYHARTTVRTFLRWQAEGGEWVFRAGFITGRPMVRWRNLVPVAFLAYSVGLIAGLLSPAPSWAKGAAAVPMTAYLALDVAESARLGATHRRPALAAILIPLFPVNHWAYGWGTVRAFVWRYLREGR